MKTGAWVLAIALVAGSCATTSPVANQDRSLSFGCDDLVVVGRVKNGDYHHVEIEDDILGHGWISGTLRVRRTIRGTAVPRAVPVRYFAHTYMREDRDFMFVANRADDGAYEIKAAEPMSGRPYPAPNCN
jgi:hypothetical protein